ncbi:MAG TPA: hypothetical protein VNA25_15650 [Phycisphaerae bacterium]|nr:hypothetical protein [Phycisphaerae bacterium]
MRPVVGPRVEKFVAGAAAVCALLAFAGGARADLRSVAYHVTYADGAFKELASPPSTNANIKLVIRVTRVEADRPGYRVLGTGPVIYADVGGGRTSTTELTWNGKAWVAPEPLVRERRAALGAQPKAAPKDIIVAEIARLNDLLGRLRERLKEHDHAVAEAERNAEKLKDTDQAAAAKEAVAKATTAREINLKAIEGYEAELKALKDVRKSEAASKPTGQVRPAAPLAKERPAAGIARPIEGRKVLGHRTQVWKLKSGRGRRRYVVSMAHPEAGEFGAFRYVAYADTDGDGRPDTLIACSPPASAAVAGGWTRWSFETAYPAVFVGNTWPDADTTTYFRRAYHDAAGNMTGLAADVFVSDCFCGMPRRKWAYPYLTNIRIDVNQDPDAQGDSGQSEMIVK